MHVTAIRAQVETTPPWVDGVALGKRLWAIERSFYEERGYMPAWVDGDRTTPQMKDLVQQFKYSELHGLDPARYPIEEFEQLRAQSQTRMGTRFDAGAVPELDAKLTYAYLRYAADLLGWTHSPRGRTRNWLVEPKKEDLARAPGRRDRRRTASGQPRRRWRRPTRSTKDCRRRSRASRRARPAT